MTQTITVAEGRAYVFVAVEHANSEVVGIHAARSANRFEALEPVRQGVHRCFGSIAPGVARGLMLRHDHGSNYMSGDFQEEIECLDIKASPSFQNQRVPRLKVGEGKHTRSFQRSGFSRSSSEWLGEWALPDGSGINPL